MISGVVDSTDREIERKRERDVRMFIQQSWNLDFAGACDKITSIEPDNCLVNSDRGNEYMQWDAWACALSGYSESRSDLDLITYLNNYHVILPHGCYNS